MQREQQPQAQPQEQDGLPAPNPRRQAGGRYYRSLFWAIVLIGVGVVALLFSLDVMEPASLGMLTYVWPILIVGFGVELLLGRRSLLAGGSVGAITVGLIVVLMVIGPRVGWTGDTELKTEIFTTPVGQAESAHMTIETGGYSADVHALLVPLPVETSAERPLFEASVAYRGAIEFEASGDADKTIALASKGQRWWWSVLDLTEAATWDIGLDPEVPIDLLVDSSSGSVKLDLGKLNLTSLDAGMSSGNMRVVLPDRGGEPYEARVRISSGDLEVGVAPGASIGLGVRMSSGDVRVVVGAMANATVTFGGSSGQFALEVVSGQAFRLEVRDVSSGSIVHPPGMVQVTGGERGEGVWETAGYSSAEDKVLLVLEHMSSGSVTIERSE